MIAENSYQISVDEKYTTEVGDIHLNSDGIVVVEYIDNLEFELSKAKMMVKLCEKIADGKKVRVLIITGKHGYMPGETRKYLATKEVGNHREAVALVINNLPHRLVANFVIKKRGDDYISKVFGDADNAMSWLKTLKNG